MSDHITLIAQAICDRVSNDRTPGTGEDLQLFRMYAVLARAKGTAVTAEDIHDAWCAWMSARNPEHAALVPFTELDRERQSQDEPFVQAVRAVALSLVGMQNPKQPEDTNPNADGVE